MNTLMVIGDIYKERFKLSILDKKEMSLPELLKKYKDKYDKITCWYPENKLQRERTVVIYDRTVRAVSSPTQ